MPSDQLCAGERSARIRFLTPEEGGRLTPPASGARSQLELGEFQTSCIVESAAGVDVLPLGEEVMVTIRILFVDQVADAFAGLTSLELFEGRRRVATGVFLDGPPDLSAQTAR